MPIQITSAVLGSIDNGLSTAFNTQLYAAASIYKQFCYDASSEGAEEVYPRLDMLPGIREWIGARQVKTLTESQFSIKNRTFEQTIEISRDKIEDDKYGLFSVVAQEMGANAARFPDLLVAQIMKAGTAQKTIDGQYFFDVDHQSWDANGNATVASNFTDGSGPGWFLIDNSRVLKPFIFQTRVPFSLVTRFNPEDPSVFDNNAFVWGTRGRCNAGYGLWQLAYYSKADLTPANLIAARTAMANLRRPDGSPMGIQPGLLVVPSTLFPRAKSLYEADLIAADGSNPQTLVQNDVVNMFKPLENPWLN